MIVPLVIRSGYRRAAGRIVQRRSDRNPLGHFPWQESVVQIQLGYEVAMTAGTAALETNAENLGQYPKEAEASRPFRIHPHRP